MTLWCLWERYIWDQGWRTQISIIPLNNAYYEFLNEDFVKVSFFASLNVSLQCDDIFQRQKQKQWLRLILCWSYNLRPPFQSLAHFSDTLTIQTQIKRFANIIYTPLSLCVCVCIICMIYKEICCRQYSNHYYDSHILMHANRSNGLKTEHFHLCNTHTEYFIF